MPKRLRVLAKELRELGYELEKPSSGSHWRVRKDGRMYPIPAHNAGNTEIPDIYLRKLAEFLGYDADKFLPK